MFKNYSKIFDIDYRRIDSHSIDLFEKDSKKKKNIDNNVPNFVTTNVNNCSQIGNLSKTKHFFKYFTKKKIESTAQVKINLNKKKIKNFNTRFIHIN